MPSTTGRRPRAAGRAVPRAGRRAAAAAAGAVLLAAPAAARAQPVLGAGDDATLPARGEVRVRVTPSFAAASSRRGGPAGTGGPRVPLGSEFATEAFGPAQLAVLAPLRDSLRAGTGNAALDLSLGTVRVAARTSVQEVPTLVEFGVTRRVALAVTVPFVTRRSSVGLDVNAGGGAGNFGINPVTDAQAGNAAREANAGAFRNLDSAATLLAARGQAALAAEVTRLRNGIAFVYGTGGAGDDPALGAVVVPLAGSDAQAAVAARLADLAARGAPLNPAAVPAPSRTRLGTRAFEQLLATPGLGLASRTLSPLGSYTLRSVGDVDVVANVRVLDTFGGDARDGGLRARVAPRAGVRVRATVGAGYRVGTAQDPLPELLFQVAADVAFGRRFSASAAARVAAPLADRATLRVADAGQPYAPLYRLRQVDRRLGRELQLELTPRYAFNEAFAVVAQASVRDRAADRYTGTFTAPAAETGVGDVTFDASGLGAGSGGRETRAGFGVAYSTLAGFAARRSRLPVELGYLHTFLASAAGGSVQNTTVDQLSVRVSARLFGR